MRGMLVALSGGEAMGAELSTRLEHVCPKRLGYSVKPMISVNRPREIVRESSRRKGGISQPC
jgi:hypothetical protein